MSKEKINEKNTCVMMAPPIDYRFISGLSLRIFPSDSSGFFFGLGGGVISVNQEVKQSRKSGE
ncbi:uncharacterized protein METZ01_LOCUS282800, partial [marine metagenome]